RARRDVRLPKQALRSFHRYSSIVPPGKPAQLSRRLRKLGTISHDFMDTEHKTSQGIELAESCRLVSLPVDDLTQRRKEAISILRDLVRDDLNLFIHFP